MSANKNINIECLLFLQRNRQQASPCPASSLHAQVNRLSSSERNRIQIANNFSTKFEIFSFQCFRQQLDLQFATNRKRLQRLYNNQERCRSLQITTVDTFVKELFRIADNAEQIFPQGHFSLARTAHNYVIEMWEFPQEFKNQWKRPIETDDALALRMIEQRINSKNYSKLKPSK